MQDFYIEKPFFKVINTKEDWDLYKKSFAPHYRHLNSPERFPVIVQSNIENKISPRESKFCISHYFIYTGWRITAC